MRFHRNLAICLVVGGLNGTQASAAENSSVTDAPTVSERSSGGVWTIVAAFDVEAPPQTAMDVLTDYQHISRFVSSVLASTIVRSTPTSALVDQRMLGRVWLFSREVHVVLDVQQTFAGDLSFTDTARDDFEVYRGAWKVTATESGARVSYFLECRPRAAFPGFIGGPALHAGTVDLITQVRTEMIRRASGKIAALKQGSTHAHE